MHPKCVRYLSHIQNVRSYIYFISACTLYTHLYMYMYTRNICIYIKCIYYYTNILRVNSRQGNSFPLHGVFTVGPCHHGCHHSLSWSCQTCQTIGSGECLELTVISVYFIYPHKCHLNSWGGRLFLAGVGLLFQVFRLFYIGLEAGLSGDYCPMEYNKCKNSVTAFLLLWIGGTNSCRLCTYNKCIGIKMTALALKIHTLSSHVCK